MTAVRHANSARAAERRRSLIEAAYRIIAEQGSKDYARAMLQLK